MRRRSLFSSAVNPFVVLADVAIMTTFILFLYLMAQSLLLNQEAFKVKALEKQQKALEQAYRDRLGEAIWNSRQVYVKTDLGVQHFYFSDRVLFDEGKFLLKPDAQAFLTPFAEIIQPRMEADRKITLVVEGHTDNIPYGVTGQDNWDLSARRAIEVVRFLQNCRYPINPRRMAASGRGEYVSIAPNATLPNGKPAGNPRNRRIEIIVQYTGAQQEPGEAR
ncbi:MAG TPA: OmpA family protein [Chthonomonadaceae bacterium]|nr:OmpA family protein [Chthonomonadaceae bacterium]